MPRSGKDRWRFYFELAPYGTLFDLMLKHQYWNQYLPEAFLWHVFDSLAEAAVQLRDCTWGNMPTDRNPRGPPHDMDQMVHFDIKPDNIFLSYPDHRSNHHQPGGSTFGGTMKYDYPVVKLGDYGLNAWTGHNDPHNPEELGIRGTSGYLPPEMMGYGAWWTPTRNANWTVPFGDSMQPKDRSSIHVTDDERGQRLGAVKDDKVLRSGAIQNFRYDEKLHVWTMGKVMYDLMTLSESSIYWRISTVDKQQFINNGKHQLPDFSSFPFGGLGPDGKPYYSTELTDLVRDCLRPFWIERIDVEEMKSRTALEMKKWDDKHVPGCEDMEPDAMDPQRDTTEPKLVYRENDIRKMPRGIERFVGVEIDDWATPEHVDAGVSFYGYLRDEIRHDPDWVELKPEWDNDTARQVKENNGTRFVTHHETWAGRRGETKIQKRYQLTPGGGLRKRPTYWVGRDKTSSSEDDDNDDDDNDDNNNGGQNPYTLPPLPPRGSRRSRSPTPPQGSPLSPAVKLEQSSETSLPRAQRATAPSPRAASPRAISPRAQPPTRQPPITRERAPSPPIEPPSDPGDCITDPSDSEVEIAIRTLRGGRKLSYYRPKRKNLKEFNEEYVRRRRGEKLNAKVEPWVRTEDSKFANAVERKKQAYRRARRGYLIRLASYERRRNLVNVNSDMNPQQNPGQPKSLLANPPSPDQQARLPVPPGNLANPQSGPPPPRLPHQAGWAEGYFRAWLDAQSGWMPPLPPDADPTDSTFTHGDITQMYTRRDRDNGMWYWLSPRSTPPRNPARWEQRPFNRPPPPQLGTLHPRPPPGPPGGLAPGFAQAPPQDPSQAPTQNPTQNPTQGPTQASHQAPLKTRQASPPLNPPRTGSLQRITNSFRLPFQVDWAEGYFQAWNGVLLRRYPGLPIDTEPTDSTFRWNTTLGRYSRLDESGRLWSWRLHHTLEDLLNGPGHWQLEPASPSALDKYIIVSPKSNHNVNSQNNPGQLGPSTSITAQPTQPAPQPAPPQPTTLPTPPPNPSPAASPRQTRPQSPSLPPLPPRFAYQRHWSDNYFEIWTYAQAGLLPPLPPDVRPTDNTINFHRGQGTYFRYNRLNWLMGWNRATRRWLRVYTDKSGRPRMRGG